jgi:hypothetical protein
MNTKSFSTPTRFLTLVALAAAAVEGCGNDNNPEPSTPVVSGGTAGSGAGVRGGTGGKGGTGNTGNEAGTGNEGGSGEVTSSGGTGNGTGGTHTGSGGTGTSSGGKGGKGGSGGKGGTGSGGTHVGTGGTDNQAGDSQGGAGAGNVVDCDPVTYCVDGVALASESCSADQQYQCTPCVPTTNDEYLSHCNDSHCSKFDNSRIENFNGTLPQL